MRQTLAVLAAAVLLTGCGGAESEQRAVPAHSPPLPGDRVAGDRLDAARVSESD